MGLSLAKTVFVRLINVSKGYILNLGPLGPLLHVKKNFHGGGWVGAAASYLGWVAGESENKANLSFNWSWS